MSYGTPPPAYSSVPAGPSTAREPYVSRDFDEDLPDDFTHKVYVTVSEYDANVRLGEVFSLLHMSYY